MAALWHCAVSNELPPAFPEKAAVAALNVLL
jgi:hypothetical protein